MDRWSEGNAELIGKRQFVVVGVVPANRILRFSILPAREFSPC